MNNSVKPNTELLYASYWLRFFAFILDAAILYGVFYIGYSILGESGTVLIFLPLVYGSLLEGLGWNATIGKKILRLVVCNVDGTRISLAKAIGRNALKYLLFVLALLVFIYVNKLLSLGVPGSTSAGKIMLLNIVELALFWAWVYVPRFIVKKPQALHDVLSKSYVMRSSA